jgi:hypothetical protein
MRDVHRCIVLHSPRLRPRTLRFMWTSASTSRRRLGSSSSPRFERSSTYRPCPRTSSSTGANTGRLPTTAGTRAADTTALDCRPSERRAAIRPARAGELLPRPPGHWKQWQKQRPPHWAKRTVAETTTGEWGGSTTRQEHDSGSAKQETTRQDHDKARARQSKGRQARSTTKQGADKGKEHDRQEHDKAGADNCKETRRQCKSANAAVWP